MEENLIYEIVIRIIQIHIIWEISFGVIVNIATSNSDTRSAFQNASAHAGERVYDPQGVVQIFKELCDA